MVEPFGRTGWSSLQKGPKIAEAVRPLELFVAAENVISSTSVCCVSPLNLLTVVIVDDL